MTPELQEALVRETSKLGAKPIGPEVFEALIKEPLDASDSEAVAHAAQRLTQEHSNLFHFEKPWSALSEDEFQERERAFKEGLRKSLPVGPNEYAKLDAALLSEEQMQALTRSLQGRGSSYDRSILQQALREQRAGGAA